MSTTRGTLFRQRHQALFSGSVALMVVLHKTMDAILNLARCREMHLHGLARHAGDSVDNERVHGVLGPNNATAYHSAEMH